MTRLGTEDLTRGYFDDKGRLTWLTESRDPDRRRLTWEGERLLRSERLSGEELQSSTTFEYGSHGELASVTAHVHGETRAWWKGSYQGTFGPPARPSPLRLYRLLDDGLLWPPHMPLVDSVSLPSFTGTLEATFGWPDAYGVRCELTRGAGRCVDDYERIVFLRDLRIERGENPKRRSDLDESFSEHLYEGGRLSRIVSKDDRGAETYATTFNYDQSGRLVKVHNTDFDRTNITDRLDYYCDDVR